MVYPENIKAYEGVESVQLNQMTEEKLREYMEEKINGAVSDADFIKNHILQNGGQISVCEIGCGNGKLLYCLEKIGVLENAVGYEVALSRARLAEKFRKLIGSTKVQIVNRDFMEDKAEILYDLIILVDIVFQLLPPLRENAEKEALQWIFDALKPGGYAFFEMEDFSYILREVGYDGKGEWRKWDEFRTPDPFQYGLYRGKSDADGNLIYEKMFIRRDGGKKESFCNVIRNYEPQEFLELLSDYGFEVEQYGYYNNAEEEARAKIDGTYKNSLYRVLARKK